MSHDAKSEKKRKSHSYPIIYSYIYEREKEDIRRLFKNFKGNKVNPHAVEQKGHIITGYTVKDGKPQPIYGTSETKKAVKDSRKIGIDASSIESKKSTKKLSPSNRKKKK